SRFERWGNAADLDRMVDVYSRAAESCAPDSTEQMLYLSNLGFALRRRYRVNGDVADLRRAVDVYANMVDRPGSPDVAANLHNLGITLRERYDLTGNLEDLERAIHA